MIFAFVGILILSLIIIILYLERKGIGRSETMIKVLSIYLLMVKTTEILIELAQSNYEAFPVEYSTVTYYLLPIVVLFNIQKLKPVATFAGIVAGFSYLILFTIRGQVLYNGTFLNLANALLNHSLLALISIVVLVVEKPFIKKFSSIMIPSLIYGCYALIMYMIIDFDVRSSVVFDLLLGRHFEKILDIPMIGVLLINYIAMAIGYSLAIKIFIFVNCFFQKKEHERLKLKLVS